MSAFLVAIQHNNRAAFLIEQGQIDEAITTLAPCIRTLREFRNLPQGTRASEAESSSPSIEGAWTLDQFMMVRPGGQQRQHPSNTSGDDDDEDMMDVDSWNNYNDKSCCSTATPSHQCGGFTYDRAVSLPEELALDTSTRSFALGTVVVMFNLALAHHLKAAASEPFSTNENDIFMMEQSFDKAARLYVLSYNLIVKQELMDSSSIQFSLAIVNNMGMIYQSLNETSKAKRYFEQSLSIIMFMVDNGMGSTIKQLDGYFHNTTTFGMFARRNATAAAA